MYAHQVWLDNLTLVTLLTINSFPFKHGLHAFNELIRDNSALLCSCVLIKSAGGSDVFLYSMIIPNFLSSPPVRRGVKLIICAADINVIQPAIYGQILIDNSHGK